MNIRRHTKQENGRRSLALLGKHDQAHLEQHSDPPASAAIVPRSMQPPTARPPATKSPFLLVTNRNQTSPASHSQNQSPDSGRLCTRATAAAALAIAASQSAPYMLCAFLVVSVLRFSVERSGAIDVSRRPKSFVTADISKSWAKILPRGQAHFRPSENLGRFFCEHFYPKKGSL